MRIRVGLGSGSKDKRIMARQMMQEPLMLAFEQGLAGPEHVFNHFDGLARDGLLLREDDTARLPE